MGQVTDEPGTDLSVATETACATCGVLVPNEGLSLHLGWHARTEAPLQAPLNISVLGNNAGMFSWMTQSQLLEAMANAIGTIQQTIGTEGNYRFLRDFGKP